MAINLDMSNAFNRGEYGYLTRFNAEDRFSFKKVSLMMNCITLVSYSVMINGLPTSYIKHSREILQGDPLSCIFFFYVQNALLLY